MIAVPSKIDAVVFGQLIGKVDSLSGQVERMSNAILPALKEQRDEMAKSRVEMHTALENHKEKDETVHKAVADIMDWMRGDGTPDDVGAKSRLNTLQANFDGLRTRAISTFKTLAIIGVIAAACGLFGPKASEALAKLSIFQ